jgi:hypothetical protein
VSVFDAIGERGHEEVVFGTDLVSGLRTIIAIHSTALGPALGGTRFYPYPSEAEALEDVLRLSGAMSLKAAAAGLDLGGGKAVIIGDHRKMKSERLWRAYGRVVDSLQGRYITAEDVGTDAYDMEMIRRETRWVVGVPVEEGGSGDPSPATAAAWRRRQAVFKFSTRRTSPGARWRFSGWARSARTWCAASSSGRHGHRRRRAHGTGQDQRALPEGRVVATRTSSTWNAVCYHVLGGMLASRSSRLLHRHRQGGQQPVGDPGTPHRRP